MRTSNQLARLILEYIGCPPGEVAKSVPQLKDLIERNFALPVLPQSGETAAITFEVPKTAALFFDRIWWGQGLTGSTEAKEFDYPPPEIVFYGATDAEVWPLVISLALRADWDWQRVEEFFGKGTPIEELWARACAGSGPRSLSTAIFDEHDIVVVPIYSSTPSYQREYRPGDMETLIAAVAGLGVADETRLEWRQVTEFRRDSDAKKKLRRMRNWVDSTFAGKPVSYVTESLEIRLDDYEWALKKHGIQTVVGSLSGVLDPKFLTGFSAATAGLALTGGSFWAAVGSTAMLAGKIALSVTTALVDLEDKARGQNSEVAFIHAIKKLAK